MQRLNTFVTHPIVALINFLLAIIGIPASILITVWFLETPKISYDHVGSVTIAKAGAANIEIAANGVKLSNDVTAADVIIWNRGRKSVRPEQVLEPVGIGLPGGAKLIAVELKACSRPRITRPGVSLGDNQALVNWAILEKGDAVKLQIVYAGGTNDSIRCDGVIEGQGVITRVPRGTRESSAGPFVSGMCWGVIIGGFSAGIGMFVSGNKIKWISRISGIAVIIALVVGTSLIIYHRINVSHNELVEVK